MLTCHFHAISNLIMVFKKKCNDIYQGSSVKQINKIYPSERIYKSNKMRDRIFLFNLCHTQRDATKHS